MTATVDALPITSLDRGALHLPASPGIGAAGVPGPTDAPSAGAPGAGAAFPGSGPRLPLAMALPANPAVPNAQCSAAQPAFADVLDWHQGEIHRYALHLTGNRADADDLFQETMLKAYRAFDRLEPESNHRAWLYRVASNTFISTRRKLDRLDSLDRLREQTPFEPTVAEPDHAAGLDARNLLADVAAFVDALPPKQRLALTLRNHHGLAYDEIAEILGSTPGAARTNVHQALRKLRAAFGDRL